MDSRRFATASHTASPLSSARALTYLLGFATLVFAAAGCSGDGPAAPAAEHRVRAPSFSQMSPSATYTFTLDCRRDASLGGNVGLTVLNQSRQTVFIGAFFCGQTVTVGPGALEMHYNINVWDNTGYRFSCENGLGFVGVVAGKVRCTLRDATFVSEEEKGIWVALTIKPA